MTSSFGLRHVDCPDFGEPERGEAFNFVSDGTHLITGRPGAPHEDLIQNLETLTGRKADRPSLTLGWVWVRATEASYSLAYSTEADPDVERQLRSWLSNGGPDRTY